MSFQTYRFSFKIEWGLLPGVGGTVGESGGCRPSRFSFPAEPRRSPPAAHTPKSSGGSAMQGSTVGEHLGEGCKAGDRDFACSPAPAWTRPSL